jgi:hypothetical protein
MKNFDQKSNMEGTKKLIHFIPTKGCIVDIWESVALKDVEILFVVILLSDIDVLDIFIDSSLIIIGPKVYLIIFSFDFGKKKKKNAKTSDKKYINIKKY